MKKKVICIVDFGQSHMKFNLITEKLIVARTLIFKNNFKEKTDNNLFYNVNKIILKLKKILKYIEINYNIISLSFVGHGSSCFIKDEKDKILSGYHHESDFLQKKILKKYKSRIPKFNETFTPHLNHFHNMGKNYFILNASYSKKKFLTLISLFGWLFSNKNISDPSYISCHSHMWDFKKKDYSSLVDKKKFIYLPKIRSAGTYLGIKNKFKIYVGGHDTSVAFYFHSLFLNKNTIFLSTGTTFVMGKTKTHIKNIAQSSGFYYLCSPNKKGVYLSRKYDSKINFKKFRLTKIKTLIKRTNREIDIFRKFDDENIKNIIIDGPFTKNKMFLNALNKANKDIKIYVAKNINSPSIGMAYICNKIKLKLNNFYLLYNDIDCS